MDRRINVVDDIPLESESEAEQISFIEQRYDPNANGGLAGASRDMSSHGHKVTHSGSHSVQSRLSHHHHAHANQYSPRSSVNGNPNVIFARQYVGELMQRVNFE